MQRAAAFILTLPLLCRFAAGAGYDINWQNEASIKDAASILAYDTMSFYRGNLSGQIPGILPGPPPGGDYHWWEGGVLWGTMIDYWHCTQDSTYNDVVMDGMLHQAGQNRDYMPANWTLSLGNDDQGFWGMAAMLAAETGFANPLPPQPQWHWLAQTVFDTMAAPDRHDGTCGGGLRWQIPSFNKGYDYKNSISNGCFFNIAARLARFTKNETYEKWATSIWDWERSIGLISDEFAVYDGASVDSNCTDMDKSEYSYNAAIWLQGAAFMFNHTNGAPAWKLRVEGLLEHMLRTFFTNDIATEIKCQNSEVNECERDSLNFKNFACRWLATVAQVAPFCKEKILPVLKASASAALEQCSGGDNGRMCGYQWATRTFDGKIGARQQMSALGALLSTMYSRTSVGAFVTKPGGDGRTGTGSKDDHRSRQITAASMAAAWILTLTVALGSVFVFLFMATDLFETLQRYNRRD